jgi:hypothetical protein
VRRIGVGTVVLAAAALGGVGLGACGDEPVRGSRGHGGNARDRVEIAASPDDSRPTLSALTIMERAAARAATKLDGDLLSFRLLEVPDAGPWRLRIDWGDGTADTPTVARPGHQTFLHSGRYPRPGRYTITVVATNAAGRASAPKTVEIAVP